MKFISIFTFAMTVLTTEGLGQWQVQQVAVTAPWSAVYFTSAHSGFVVTSNAGGLKTSNGGQQWVARTSNSSYVPAGSSIQFISESVGFVVGSAIVKTTDGGESWRNVYTHSVRDQFRKDRNTYKAIVFRDTLHGYAAGYCWDCSAMVATRDGGEAWTDSIRARTIPPIGDCQVAGVSANGQVFVACWTVAEWLQFTEMHFLESQSEVWSRVDGWNLHPGSSFFFAKSMHWTVEKTGWIGGGKRSLPRMSASPYNNSRVFFTTDGGETWDTTKYVFPYTVNTIAFADSLRGFIGDTAGNIYSTTDGGTTWQNDNVPSGGRSINSIAIAGGTAVYAVGDGGLILKRELVTSVAEGGEQEQPQPTQLQIVPNPTSGEVELRYQQYTQGEVEIIIVNTNGQSVLANHHPNQGIGLHREVLDLSSLPPGIYYCSLRAGLGGTNHMIVRLP